MTIAPSSKVIYWLFLRFLSGEGIALSQLLKDPEPFTPFFSFHRLWSFPQYLVEEGWIPSHPLFSRWDRWGKSEDERFEREVEEIDRALSGEGIPATFLKGVVRRRSLYPRRRLRLPVDIDLYLSRGDLEKVGRLLLDLGYLPETPFPPPQNFEWVFSAPGRFPVDLHWALWLPHRLSHPFPPPEAFTEEDHRLYELVHFAQHKGELRWDQEADLVLGVLTGGGFSVPQVLSPYAFLLGERLTGFYGISNPFSMVSIPFGRRMSLRTLYRPVSAHPFGSFAPLKRLLLPFFTFSAIRQIFQEMVYLFRSLLSKII
jgi:hypothetical protein